MSRTSRVLVSAILIAAVAPAGAQPMPVERRTYGVLVSDTAISALYLMRDLDADGLATGKGETTVFADASNLSGYPGVSSSVFALAQAVDDSIFVGEGDTDTVYRLRDNNGDGDAQDFGEITIWFQGAAEIRTPTPNGIAIDSHGAVYIASAGVSAQGVPSAIIRTIDLDSDGTAQGAGEAAVWLDAPALIGASTPFDICFVGDVAYFADLRAGNPDAIFRAHDANNDDSISTDELRLFIDDTNTFGVPCSFSAVTDGVAVYVHESTGNANPQRVFRLTDTDNSGDINAAEEAREVWNESLVPAGVALANSFSISAGPAGSLAITSNGNESQDNIFLARDLDASGDLLQGGETTALRPGSGTEFPETARAVLFIAYSCPVDWNADALVNSQDFFDFLTDFFANNADYNRDGVTNSQDYFDFLTGFFAGC